MLSLPWQINRCVDFNMSSFNTFIDALLFTIFSLNDVLYSKMKFSFYWKFSCFRELQKKRWYNCLHANVSIYIISAFKIF